jgi:hypothetical protein
VLYPSELVTVSATAPNIDAVGVAFDPKHDAMLSLLALKLSLLGFAYKTCTTLGKIPVLQCQTGDFAFG